MKMNNVTRILCGVLCVLMLVGSATADCLENWTIGAGNAGTIVCTNNIINMTGTGYWDTYMYSLDSFSGNITASWYVQQNTLSTANFRVGFFNPNDTNPDNAETVQLSFDEGGVTRLYSAGGAEVGASCATMDTNKHLYNMTVVGGVDTLYLDGTFCSNVTQVNTVGYVRVLMYAENVEFSEFQITDLDATTTTSTTTTSTTTSTTSTTTTTLPPTTTTLPPTTTTTLPPTSTTLPVTTTTLGGYKAGDIAGAFVTGMYLFVNGMTGYAGDIGSILVLGFAVFAIITAAVMMTDGGKKVMKDIMNIKK
jgi:hypothetical protein